MSVVEAAIFQKWKLQVPNVAGARADAVNFVLSSTSHMHLLANENFASR